MSFVIALPLLLLFLFAVVDVGRTVFLHMALADATHAACRVAATVPEGTSVEALRKEAMVASPALAVDGLQLSINVRYGEIEESTYEHHVYNDVVNAFERRTSCVKRQKVVVELELEGHYLTPLGPALSAAEGRGDASFSYRARSVGIADKTVEGGA